MRRRVDLDVRIFAFFLVLLLAPALPAADLDTVLASMDKASSSFQSMQADVRWVKYTALVDDESVDEGTIIVRRAKDKGVDLLIDFQRPYPYYLAIQGTKVEIYRPKIAEVQEYDLSKKREMLDQALLLGFGTAGKFLSENYNVKLIGEEQAAGHDTVKLELAPKSADMQKNIPRIEMWISKASWQPVQQKMWQPAKGDYRLYTYTNIKQNPALPDKAFQLKIPKGVKRVYPQR
jgi:outer membrane lipoprotein-sorting protein